MLDKRMRQCARLEKWQQRDTRIGILDDVACRHDEDLRASQTQQNVNAPTTGSQHGGGARRCLARERVGLH